MEEIKGEKPEERPEPTIDLQVGAYIPDDYVSDRMLKVNFYQQLSRVVEETEIDGIRDELRDRFGRLPDPAAVLLDVVSIKRLAGTAGVKSVAVRGEELVIVYPAGVYPSKKQIAVLTRDPHLPIEFLHASSFGIRVGLKGLPEVERTRLTKNILQMLG